MTPEEIQIITESTNKKLEPWPKLISFAQMAHLNCRVAERHCSIFNALGCPRKEIA
jgi:hypothetical protein